MTGLRVGRIPVRLVPSRDSPARTDVGTDTCEPPADPSEASSRRARTPGLQPQGCEGPSCGSSCHMR